MSIVDDVHIFDNVFKICIDMTRPQNIYTHHSNTESILIYWSSPQEERPRDKAAMLLN